MNWCTRRRSSRRSLTSLTRRLQKCPATKLPREDHFSRLPLRLQPPSTFTSLHVFREDTCSHLPGKMSCATSRRSSRPSARSSTRPSPRCPATKTTTTTTTTTNVLPVRVYLSTPSHLYYASLEKVFYFPTSFNTITLFHTMNSCLTLPSKHYFVQSRLP